MSDSFLEAVAVRAAGKLVTEARCEVLLFGCCRSPELAITMGESFKPAWAEYIAMHGLLVASSTPFLMFDNSSWWQLHPALHIDASPLTVDKIAEALRIHRPRVVHFGTHGDQTGFAIQWEAAGGDGAKRCRVRLRASDIRERLDLRGAIVVSSACSTGSENLGEAILAAGAIAYVAPQMKNAIHLLGGFMGELLPRCARALSAAAATGGGTRSTSALSVDASKRRWTRRAHRSRTRPPSESGTPASLSSPGIENVVSRILARSPFPCPFPPRCLPRHMGARVAVRVWWSGY